MSKDPTPKADGLRAMREASRGHLQATAETPAGYVAGATVAPDHAPPKKPLIPYAGKDRTVQGSRGGIPYSKNPKPDGPKPPSRRSKLKRKIV